MFLTKKAILLDMNSTFMFGEDNFDESEDFSRYYRSIGGTLSDFKVNSIIRTAYDYLNCRYPDEKYRHEFPSVESAIDTTIDFKIDKIEKIKLIDTFAHHEIGKVSDEYIAALHSLNQKYLLAVVIDIWAPKHTWLTLFEKLGIHKLFKAMSFSSDHGMVKPSPLPFELVIEQLGIDKEQGLIVGDSIRRDLGGALASGIDCVLVGDAKHPEAVECFDNLLEFSRVA